MTLYAVGCGRQRRGQTPGDEVFPEHKKHSLIYERAAAPKWQAWNGRA
jgi:hypothetical protein